MLCNSTDASFHVPEDKWQKFHSMVLDALAVGSIHYATLEKLVGKAVSMAVAVRPASLWTFHMYDALKRAGKPGKDRKWKTIIPLPVDSGLRGELVLWSQVQQGFNHGPWYKARHFRLDVVLGASDASSRAWGGVLRVAGRVFEAAGEFSDAWMVRPINAKEVFALHATLLQYCQRYPDSLQGFQLIMDVDNHAAVAAFAKGRSSDQMTHDLLLRLFWLQRREGFWLRLRWVPSEANGEADALSRPSLEEILRLVPAQFARLWDVFGALSFDLMATDVSAHKVPLGFPSAGARLPFFSRYACPGSSGVDVLAQDVGCLPGCSPGSLAFCFPPIAMVGALIQHISECRARAVLIVPDFAGPWFPLLQSRTRGSITVSEPGDSHAFAYTHHQRVGLQPFVFRKWAMRAVEVDFT